MEAMSDHSPSRLPFRDAEDSFSGLDADTIAALVVNSSDIALVIEDGRIRDAAVSLEDLRRSGVVEGWIGKEWAETVTVESRPKISALLNSGGSLASQPARHVNHPTTGAKELPIAYRTVATKHGNRMIALGRDLRTAADLQQRLLKVQQELEHDYGLMRQAEARYRTIFQAVSEAILIVDADQLKVEDANPAAAAQLQMNLDDIGQGVMTNLFDPSSARALERMIAQAAANGQSSCNTVTGRKGEKLKVLADAFRQGRDVRVICRIFDRKNNAVVPEMAGAPLLSILEELPDGFVVADSDLRIVTANKAFISMTQLMSRSAISGARLADFLGRSTTDLNVLISAIRTNGSARNFATIIRDRFGSEEDVEVSGVNSGEDGRALYGFSIRNVGRRLSTEPPIREELPKSVEHLTSLVGRMPLKDIVRDSTALIERLCIEAALRLTDDNRASAAEILGLSRQGLYSKLNRFGFEDKE